MGSHRLQTRHQSHLSATGGENKSPLDAQYGATDLTLILGALTPDAIVLAADGLCRKDEADGRTWYQENLQKIFPLRDRPLAIVHHGQNVINGRDVRRLIEEFEDANRGALDALDVLSTANLFRDFVGNDVMETLSALSKAGFQPDGVGFWVAGILPRQGPRLYELFWPHKPDPRRHPSDGGATGRIIGGDGQNIAGDVLQRYKSRFRPERLKPPGVAHAQEYVRRLYHQASQHHDQICRNRIFGGKYHELVVLDRGWEWTIPITPP